VGLVDHLSQGRRGRLANSTSTPPSHPPTQHPSPFSLIIRLIIQTIRQDPSGPIWTDDPSNVSRPDPSGGDQIDAEHQVTDLVVSAGRVRWWVSDADQRAPARQGWAPRARSGCLRPTSRSTAPIGSPNAARGSDGHPDYGCNGSGSVGYSGAVSSSATPSGSLNGSTAMPNGGRSVISLCSTPRSSNACTAASSSARPATPKLR
jgi:hypothetical protein